MGVNDVTIAGGILAFFILSGVLLPYVYSDLAYSGSNLESAGLSEEQLQQGTVSDNIGTMELVKSIFRVMFWLPTYIPFWLRGIFYLMRIILLFILARNIWIGGGA